MLHADATYKRIIEMMFALIILVLAGLEVIIAESPLKLLSTTQHYKTEPSFEKGDMYGLIRNMKPSLLCWVMTFDSHDNKKKVSAIDDTWATRCDKTIFVQKGDGKAVLKNKTLTVPLETESREELWHKVIQTFTFIYDHYLNDFEWFVKTDDDTYIIVESLKRFLRRRSDPSKPIYFGYKFKPYVVQGYMSGGSGYVLSREALRLLVENGFHKNLTECHIDHGQVEDVEMGACLQAVGVKAGDTRDSLGRPTFLPLSPSLMINRLEPWSGRDWFYNYTFYGHPKTGKDCCSSKVISFHYMAPEEIRFVDWLLYSIRNPHLF